jgi:hypothetical protein
LPVPRICSTASSLAPRSAIFSSRCASNAATQSAMPSMSSSLVNGAAWGSGAGGRGFGRRLKYLSGHSPPIFVQLPKADRFCGRLEAISRKFPLAPRPCHETRRPSRVRGQQNPCPAWLLALLELQRR